MFWGLVLEPSRSYAQVVDTPFHVSMAALDLKKSDNQEEASTLILRQDNTEYVLANLSKKHKIFNIPLGLDFDVGEDIEFFVQGQSQIHLTGFLAGDDNDDLDEMNEEDEDSDIDVSEKAKDIKKAEATKRKLKPDSSPAKKLKILNESLDDDTDEDDFTFDEDDLGDLEEEEDSEESDEDDDDEDEDMSDEASPVKKEQKPQQQQKQANNAQSPLSKKQKKKLHQDNQSGKPNQQQQANKQNNQQQGNKHQKNQKTPQKNQQPNKTPQKTPQGKTPQAKTPQTGNKQQNAKSPQGTNDPPKHNRKILKGGIIVEDIVEGKGKVAASSKRVGVYYVGRLASNKKEFDKNLSGKPFSFSLGRGEVIRGWDMGLEGMREGGKRKIVIPPKFAYGHSGAPPTIPPNSALEFEVTLVNVK